MNTVKFRDLRGKDNLEKERVRIAVESRYVCSVLMGSLCIFYISEHVFVHGNFQGTQMKVTSFSDTNSGY